LWRQKHGQHASKRNPIWEVGHVGVLCNHATASGWLPNCSSIKRYNDRIAQRRNTTGLCLGMHVVMHKMMGKSCHAKSSENHTTEQKDAF
jgi:hypothetical protein